MASSSPQAIPEGIYTIFNGAKQGWFRWSMYGGTAEFGDHSPDVVHKWIIEPEGEEYKIRDNALRWYSHAVGWGDGFQVILLPEYDAEKCKWKIEKVAGHDKFLIKTHDGTMVWTVGDVPDQPGRKLAFLQPWAASDSQVFTLEPAGE